MKTKPQSLLIVLALLAGIHPSPGSSFVKVDGPADPGSPPSVGGWAGASAVRAAHAPDTAPPTLVITSPTPNQRWSNAVFTIAGTAKASVAVSNVLYSLNNAGWNPAATGNRWTNWNAPVTLIPGTNTISAWAIDVNGLVSKTNTVKCCYVLNAILSVRTNGAGTISPSYNGATLPIGSPYSLTARPSNGFGFVNWTDGSGNVITNGTTLKFIMASNLVWVANFVDTTKPTLSIAAPTSNLRVSNSVFTVTGKAGDNVAVYQVLFSLNGGAWTPASTGNQWTNWTATVTLSPGTNTLKACAIGAGGLSSLTNSVTFFYQFVPFSIASVSSTSPTPLSPLTITLAGRKYSGEVSVMFYDAAGFSFYTSPLRYATNGTVIVAVPLYVDPVTSLITNGVVSLAVQESLPRRPLETKGGPAAPVQPHDITAPVTLNIQNLPPLSSYGTQPGEISHAFLIYEAMLIADRRGLLQAVQLLEPSIDTSTTQSHLTTLLEKSLGARSEVDSLLLTNATVISWGTLPDGSPAQFGQTELDLMDRIFAVYLTQHFAGFPSANFSSAAGNPARNLTSTFNEIMSMLVHQDGVVKLFEYAQGKGGPADAGLAVLDAGQHYLAAAETPVGELGMFAGLAHVQETVNEELAQLIPAATCCADPACTSTAAGEAMTSAGLQVAGAVGSAMSGAYLVAWGEESALGSTAAAGLDAVGTIAQNFTSGTAEADAALGVTVASSPSLTQKYTTGQGLAQMPGTAANGNDSGIGGPQSSLNLCCLGASALGIQGLADPSGDYDLFVALGVPGTDYSKLTLTASSGGVTWGSETVDLTGLDTGKPVQVPPVPPPPTYYTLSIATAGTGTGTVTANPAGSVYVSGTKVALSAVPNTGSTFVSWSGDASGSSRSTTLTMNANKSVTATFNNPDAVWNGTWSGSWSYSDTGGCGFSGGGSIAMTFSVANNAVSGSGSMDGIECENTSDCTFDDYDNSAGSVAGTVSGTTIHVNYSGTTTSGSCAGGSWDLTLTGNLSGTTITGSLSKPGYSEFSGSFRLTKQ